MSALFVGVDQSYTGFGLSLLYPEDGHTHTTVLGKFPLDKFINPAQRLIAVSEWLRQRVSDHPVAVAMEGYAPGTKFGREMAGELGGQVKVHFWHTEGIVPLIVTPGQLKKYVTGKGTAAKNEMLLGVYKRWGVEFNNDNLADAYGLAQIAYGRERFLNGDTEGLTKFQLEVLAAL